MIAGASSERVEKINNRQFRLYVKEPAVRNLANRRVIKIMSVLFSGKGGVKIVSGYRSPNKIISID